MDEQEYAEVLAQAKATMLWILRTWAQYESKAPPAESPTPGNFPDSQNNEGVTS
jgi:hypothetical protein